MNPILRVYFWEIQTQAKRQCLYLVSLPSGLCYRSARVEPRLSHLPWEFRCGYHLWSFLDPQATRYILVYILASLDKFEIFCLAHKLNRREEEKKKFCVCLWGQGNGALFHFLFCNYSISLYYFPHCDSVQKSLEFLILFTLSPHNISFVILCPLLVKSIV